MQKFTRLALVTLSIPLTVSLVGCAGDDMPPQVYSFCVDYYTDLCEKSFDCSPGAAKIGWGVSSKSGCADMAMNSCSAASAEAAEPGCVPSWPSQSQMDSCISQTQKWSCTDYLNTPEGPAACQQIQEPCPDDDDDENQQSTGSSGNTPPPPQKTNTCPYTTQSFSCAAACENLWKLVSKCSSDPAVPASLKSLFKTMASMPKTTAMAACKTTCAAQSASYGNQWKCFQAAPTNSCTAVAACTVSDCP